MKTKKMILGAMMCGVLFAPSAFAKSQKEDTVPPETVVNVVVESTRNGAVLTWDAASDDEGVVGYKVYYGNNSIEYANGFYPFEKETVDTQISFNDLTSGKDYYFAVTALDEAGNESLDYSIEKSLSLSGDACGLDHLELCSVAECKTVGGYYYDSVCNLEKEIAVVSEHNANKVKPEVVAPEPELVAPVVLVEEKKPEEKLPEAGAGILIPFAVAGVASVARKFKK